MFHVYIYCLEGMRDEIGTGSEVYESFLRQILGPIVFANIQIMTRVRWDFKHMTLFPRYGV